MTHTQQTSPKQSGFYGLGIAPALLEVLDRLKLTVPTPIQAKAIPIAIEGKDVVGIAQTGTGKTFAFGIPMMQRIARLKKQGLVIAPTRELALQIEEALMSIGKTVRLRTAVLIGGAPFGPQMNSLRKKPHIIVATPGRLNDHLEQKTLRLDQVGVLVLDEADRMLDMGFLPQIRKILALLPAERQTMLFSATMSREIMSMAAQHMKLPVSVEIAPQGTTAEKVSQELFFVSREKKIALLQTVLQRSSGSTLVFSRTKHGAKKIARQVRAMGIAAAEIHSNRSLNQRREALDGFKTGKYRVLIATDIASRGIDVVGIELVVNFDLPMTSEDYVHRIGRTARASASGHAITFAVPDQKKEVQAIERLIRKQLPVSPLPALPYVPALPQAAYEPRRQFSRGPRQQQYRGRGFRR